MEKDAEEPGKAEDKARAEADKLEAARVVLLRVMSAPACVRNAGIVNRISTDCPACKSNAQSAEPH